MNVSPISSHLSARAAPFSSPLSQQSAEKVHETTMGCVNWQLVTALNLKLPIRQIGFCDLQEENPQPRISCASSEASPKQSVASFKMLHPQMPLDALEAKENSKNVSSDDEWNEADILFPDCTRSVTPLPPISPRTARALPPISVGNVRPIPQRQRELGTSYAYPGTPGNLLELMVAQTKCKPKPVLNVMKPINGTVTGFQAPSE